MGMPVLLTTLSASAGWLVARWVGPDAAGALSSSACSSAGWRRSTAVILPTPGRSSAEGSAQTSSPLVSVVTPVFNGAKYLRACIESVLAQSYDNWNYTIVDNCSTDGSLAIAREYAAAHPRITVGSNEEFVGIVENHNRAVRAISPEAKYCKVVSADDWIYPECISKLVDLAERHPSVGIVGSYSADTGGLRRVGLPLGKDVLAGREAARLYLLGALDNFFLPSTVLYRGSMVRATGAFFPGSASSADLEACLNCLKDSDLGFVHQILSFERIHDEMFTAKLWKMNIVALDRIKVLIEYGPEFLCRNEQDQRLQEQLTGYFDDQAAACFRVPDREFWRLHKDRLEELGYSIYNPRFAKAIAGKFLDLTLNPKATTEKVASRVRSRGRARQA
jgi:glycosyltransferase involved in cell wall biosynthesis